MEMMVHVFVKHQIRLEVRVIAMSFSDFHFGSRVSVNFQEEQNPFVMVHFII